MMATRKSARMERDIQLSTHEQEEFEEQDIKNILPGKSLNVENQNRKKKFSQYFSHNARL
jgi:hypothetical protein